MRDKKIDPGCGRVELTDDDLRGVSGGAGESAKGGGAVKCPKCHSADNVREQADGYYFCAACRKIFDLESQKDKSVIAKLLSFVFG